MGWKMGRSKSTLTAIEVHAAPNGPLSDGGGLSLVEGRWSYRYSYSGKRREMGLGTYPTVTLAAARKARDRWAGVLLGGKDPITERDRLIATERAAMDRHDPTFAEIAQTVFDGMKASLRGGGDRGRWFSPLAVHIIPKIGAMRLSQIHQTDLHKALKPIWKTKNETAEKALQRIGIIFRKARLMGMQCDPFTVEATRHMLGEVRRKVTPIVSTPWQDMPALYQRLGDGMAHMCLRMMILTVVRSAGVRGMRYSEIDGGVWTVPAERMKAIEGREESFRVPLPTEAARMIDAAREFAQSDWVFPGQGRKLPHVTDTALSKSLTDLGEAGRPHGFRSSFRTWAQDCDHPWDVAETALAHSIGAKTERSYARSDLLDRRRVVMDKWAAHVTGQSAQVVQLKRG